MTCPVCQANHVYPSHRRGFLERGPFTWVAVLPFRCSLCQTRFYRISPKDLRRRRSGANSGLPTDKLRAPRWATNVHSIVAVATPQGAETAMEGRAEDASIEGARLRLPVALNEGSRITVSFEGEPARSGVVRWTQSAGKSGTLHGIRFEGPLARRARHSRPLLRLRLRRLLRRTVISMVGLAVMAVAAYGIVWLIEEMRIYDPKYYEPKDVERELQDFGRRMQETKRPQRP